MLARRHHNNERDPFYSLARQLTGLPLRPLQRCGVPAESDGFANKRLAWEAIAPLFDRALPLRTAHLRDPVCAANSVKARDRAVVRGGAIAEVEHDFVDVTPPPAFGWVIAFDDRMACSMEMLGGVAVRRVVATADMAAGPA